MMAKPTFYPHPNPTVYRLIQYILFGLLVIMTITIPLQIGIALSLGLPLLMLSALLTALLMVPVMMGLSNTPPVEVSDDGLLIQPLIWREQFIAWENVEAVKDYPLLPTSDQEVERRVLSGRKTYRPAEGKMLVVRGLPFQYRTTGFFVGERGKTVIAVTNRSHAHYERLIQRIEKHYKSQ